MIIGIGTDLCNINRIQTILKDYGKRFLNRIFSDSEINRAKHHASMSASLAMAFSAKEACSKALGTGMKNGVCYKTIHLRHHKSGQPYIDLQDGSLKLLNKLIPEGKNVSIHVSLSDEYPLVNAIVVIYAF